MIERDWFFKRPVELRKVELDGGEIWVRPLTLTEDEESSKYRRDSNEWQTYLIRVSCCDEDGNPFFVDNDQEALSKVPAKYMSPIMAAILRVNSWIDDDNNEDDVGNQ
jgi:hypothetical protein